MTTQICSETHVIFEKICNYFSCYFSQGPEKTNILNLPKPVLEIILKNLNEAKDRAQFAMACSRFSVIVREKRRNGEIWNHTPYLMFIRTINSYKDKIDNIERDKNINECKKVLCGCVTYGLPPCCLVSGFAVTLSTTGCCCCTTSYLAQKILLCGLPIGIGLGGLALCFSCCCGTECIKRYEHEIHDLERNYSRTNEVYQRLTRRSNNLPVILMEEGYPSYQNGSI